MKIFIFLILTIMSLSLLADCEGEADKHIVRALQKNADVEVSLLNKELHPYRDIGNTTEGKFKISGKEVSIIVVHNTDLETFMKNKSLGREVFFDLILGRREYDGEYDMAWSYAEDFLNALVCKKIEGPD